MKHLIILCGRAGAGKDTFADLLVERFGYKKIAFADTLRDVALEIWNGFSKITKTIPSLKLEDLVSQASKNSQIESLVLDDEAFTPRKLLQWIGTDVLRKHIGEDVWIRTLLRKTENIDKIIITDCRFVNEFFIVSEDMKNRGYKMTMIRIVDPDFIIPEREHISETSLNDLISFSDVEIINSKRHGIEVYKQKIIEIATKFT